MGKVRAASPHKVLSFDFCNDAAHCVHVYCIAIVYDGSGIHGTDNAWQTIFSGHDRTMRYQATQFGDDTGQYWKIWTPGNVGAVCDQNVASPDFSHFAKITYHTRTTTYVARTHWRSLHLHAARVKFLRCLVQWLHHSALEFMETEFLPFGK